MSFITFILVFGIIVTIHEFGHFYFAKKSGILVREFAIGMGPKIFATMKNGTAYTIRLLPLGGYVRMASHIEDNTPLHFGQVIKIIQNDEGIVTQLNISQFDKADEIPFEVHEFDLENQMFIKGKFFNQEDIVTLVVSKKATIVEENGTVVLVAPIETHFETASVFKRILVNFAGPLNNFILGIFLFTLAAFLSGGVTSNSNVINVMDNGSAYQQGLQSGDKIISVNGQSTNTYTEIANKLEEIKKQNINEATIVIDKNGVQTSMTIPFINNLIGITPSKDKSVQAKLSYGFSETYRIATSIINLLSTIFKGTFSINELGGPVAIAQATNEVTNKGFLTIILFTAMLSVNLGMMNLLPIPGLDGGKLLLNIIEIIRRKPMSQEKEMFITTMGAIFLIILMIVVTFNDITRWF